MLSLRYVPLTRQIAALPLFNVARTLATTAEVKKTVKKTPNKATADLKKAKKDLKDIEKKLEAKSKSIEKLSKQRAKKDAEKVHKEAVKSVRRINAYAYFVKQTGGKKINELAKDWQNLSESEKEKFKTEAAKYNDELIKLFPPKPKAPANGYAAFMKEHYPYGETSKSFAEISKEISNQWRQLTESEKEAYKTSKGELENYQQKLKSWTEQRLANYKQHVASK